LSEPTDVVVIVMVSDRVRYTNNQVNNYLNKYRKVKLHG
jgi:hypothetical protein